MCPPDRLPGPSLRCMRIYGLIHNCAHYQVQNQFRFRPPCKKSRGDARRSAPPPTFPSSLLLHRRLGIVETTLWICLPRSSFVLKHLEIYEFNIVMNLSSKLGIHAFLQRMESCIDRWRKKIPFERIEVELRKSTYLKGVTTDRNMPIMHISWSNVIFIQTSSLRLIIIIMMYKSRWKHMPFIRYFIFCHFHVPYMKHKSPKKVWFVKSNYKNLRYIFLKILTLRII